jgi:excisionase family DNA binding protein
MKTTDLVSVAEAAEIAGCSEPTIRKKLIRGDLEGEKIGVRVWLVSRHAASKLAETISNRSKRKRAEAAALAARSRRSKRA